MLAGGVEPAGGVESAGGVDSVGGVIPASGVESSGCVELTGGLDLVGTVEPAVASSIDWDSLQILERNDVEGRLEIVDDEHFYELLGLRAEDERAKKARELGADGGNLDGIAPEVGDTTGAAIPVDDVVPGEMGVVYDPDKPNMDIGTLYPSMKEFRLAMRQFAINKEFELDVVATDKERYIGGCKGDDCVWHIVGRVQPNGKTVKACCMFALNNVVCFLFYNG